MKVVSTWTSSPPFSSAAAAASAALAATGVNAGSSILMLSLLLAATATATATAATPTSTSACAIAAWAFVPITTRRGGLIETRPFGPASSVVGTTQVQTERHVEDALTMKVSRGKSRKTPHKSSSIYVSHTARIRSAGRVGTKRHIDPTKLFIGNLSYETDEDDILDMLSDHLGPKVTDMNVESVKIVRDWRTGRSRGYGFVQFLDPMMATSAVEGLNGRVLMGRKINFDQGQRRKDPDRIWIKKRERASMAAAAAAASEAAAAEEDVEEAEDGEEGEDMHISRMISLDEFDEADDVALFASDGGGGGDDDDFEFDGIFEEVYRKELADDDEDDDTVMNRAQRREASKGKKKKKLPHKGFG